MTARITIVRDDAAFGGPCLRADLERPDLFGDWRLVEGLTVPLARRATIVTWLTAVLAEPGEEG